MNHIAQYKWHFSALAAALGWGLQYAVTDNAMRGMKAADWVTYYFLGGAVVCVAVQLGSNHSLPIPAKGMILPVLICAGVGLSAQYSIISAIVSKNATQASLLENAVPIFAFLFGGLLFGNWEISWRIFAGFALMAGGIILVGSS